MKKIRSELIFPVLNQNRQIQSGHRVQGPRPDICHIFSTNVLLGSIFLHMKARKLWQKFRDKTA